MRWTYNHAVGLYNSLEGRELKTAATDKPITWKQFLRQQVVSNKSELIANNPWALEVGYDIRDYAVKEFCTALRTEYAKKKEGGIKNFRMKFRSKKSRSESIYLRKRWISVEGHTLTIKFPKQSAMKFTVPSLTEKTVILMDCRLQRTWLNEYFLCVPETYTADDRRVENQDPEKSLKVCSLDPGVRTFQTIYDPSREECLEVGAEDMKAITRLCIGADKLEGRMSQSSSKKKYHLRRACRRLRRRIRCLVDEVHKQLAKYLATSYDAVMIPTFEVSNMVRKADRKIRKATVRQMLSWSHYRFRQRLISKCREYGSKVVVVNEAYTSKTCSGCGELNVKLGGKKVFRCEGCGVEMDRDMNGAKNIFLRNATALKIQIR